MKKLLPLILISVLFISCTSTRKSSYADYWSKAPDLTKIVYEGGDGKSEENSVIIKNAQNELNGIASEYAYISKKHGVKFTNWKPIGQSTNTKNGRQMDVIVIQTIPEKETVVYYFDITDFYGKF